MCTYTLHSMCTNEHRLKSPLSQHANILSVNYGIQHANLKLTKFKARILPYLRRFEINEMALIKKTLSLN
jgi:hypothetical protein